MTDKSLFWRKGDFSAGEAGSFPVLVPGPGSNAGRRTNEKSQDDKAISRPRGKTKR